MVLVSKSDSLITLRDLAISLGANAVSIVNSSSIVINADLARLCKDSGGGCKNYGMSLSCPPNVEGPSGFKKWQKSSDRTIVIRIDIPRTILFSNERLEVMKLLHEIVANIEKRATEIGYPKSRSFAGGSCKEIFCCDYPECKVLADKAECRNPEARPSMSGFGVDVQKLMNSIGWCDVGFASISKSNEDTTWIVGIVLIIK